MAFQLSNARNHIELIHDSCMMFWSFAAVFSLCHFGDSVSTSFDKLNDTLFECDWYLFPNKLQRSFLTTAIAAQKPISIKGFGNVTCTRHSFKEVSKKLRSIQHIWFLIKLLLLGFTHWIFVFYGIAEIWKVNQSILVLWSLRNRQ